MEDGNGMNPVPTASSPSIFGKVVNNVKWGGEKLLHGAEFLGEVFADFFGITDSKYQYVIDAKERYLRQLELEKLEEEESIRLEEERLNEEELKSLAKAEGGEALPTDDAGEGTGLETIDFIEEKEEETESAGEEIVPRKDLL